MLKLVRRESQVDLQLITRLQELSDSRDCDLNRHPDTDGFLIWERLPSTSELSASEKSRMRRGKSEFES